MLISYVYFSIILNNFQIFTIKFLYSIKLLNIPKKQCSIPLLEWQVTISL